MSNFSKQTNILDLLPKVTGRYCVNEPMSKHTWFAVGGPAEIMYHPSDREDLKHFIQTKPQNIPIYIIGGGSNILVRDGGIPGVVIKLDNKNFRQIEIGKNHIKCGAGKSNTTLKKTFVDNQIGGLEFLCSIPGFIGGSIKTNAGCFGQEIKDVLIEAEIINELGEIITVSAEDLNLSYRSSYFPDNWIILSITLKTQQDTKENIRKKLKTHQDYRKKFQPYNAKTGGSTFKNPKGLKAWELIKKSNCSNLHIGGARISEIHHNFLINSGNATAEDIERLGEKIITQVKKTTSITLEWEIKRLGIKKIINP